jgi:uncharacterized membrane protein YdbT with pleckstrin-like domain
MSYLDSNLLPDERILFRTKKHPIIFFGPVVMLVFAVFVSVYLRQHAMTRLVIIVPWLAAALIWGVVWLNYYTSEFAVTNKRVMMREGFFVRHANELRLTAISQVNVEQNLLGVMLNFGTVQINAFGAFDGYSMIDHPGVFQKTVNEQLDRALTR